MHASQSAHMNERNIAYVPETEKLNQEAVLFPALTFELFVICFFFSASSQGEMRPRFPILLSSKTPSFVAIFSDILGHLE